MMRKALPSYVIVLALLLATPLAHANELQLGKTAPPVTLVTLDGRAISTESLRGHTLLLTFWASWCEPCQTELPLLSRFAAAHRDQGLMVLGFSLDEADDLEKVRAIAKTLQFPVGLLNQSSVQGYGRMWRIPVSFVIDRDGILRYDGWKATQATWDEAGLNAAVTPWLPPRTSVPHEQTSH
jgi:cytochrome c biogenesis protein CcmG/thiol:disulfide interchange protein DsbE